MSARRQPDRAESQISNPLVQVSLLGEAIDGADLAMLVSDEEGRCIAVNRQACALLGYTRDELLRLEVSDIVPESDSRECHRRVHATGRSEGIAKVLRSDGSPLALRYWSTPTQVAQIRLVLSFSRPETTAAAAELAASR